MGLNLCDIFLSACTWQESFHRYARWSLKYGVRLKTPQEWNKPECLSDFGLEEKGWPSRESQLPADPNSENKMLVNFHQLHSSNSQVTVTVEMPWVVRVRNAETDQETNMSLRTDHSWTWPRSRYNVPSLLSPSVSPPPQNPRIPSSYRLRFLCGQSALKKEKIFHVKCVNTIVLMITCSIQILLDSEK